MRTVTNDGPSAFHINILKLHFEKENHTHLISLKITQQQVFTGGLKMYRQQELTRDTLRDLVSLPGELHTHIVTHLFLAVSTSTPGVAFPSRQLHSVGQPGCRDRL